ncbi:MAG: CoA-acylating methylmalonate-semialdehyde dehydrogenase [Actinomycetota bacterium]|nr:CoA-acylating methylmalonate-semialdehyde dehydrogenase [Actinomycetota bacterium]
MRHFVGGAWLDGASDTLIDDRDPATGELLARVPAGGAADVDAAVQAARRAQAPWATTPPQVRARAIYRLRDVLDAHREELASIVTRDMGKTTDDALAEVGRAIESVEAAMSGVHQLKGQILEGIATGVDVELVRQPVGVVAAITPFNFPAMLPMWFLPFAVVTGNAFVLKPSEQVPLTAERYMELIDGIDEIPKGLINMVHGGHEPVNAILEHPGIAAVSFVGSASTARYVATKGTEAGKRVQALGGAKNAFIVLPDADLRTVASGVAGSAFGAAGQRCMAGSVAVLVGTGEEQDRALGAIVDAAKGLRTGAGADPTTDVCPVISVASRERLVEEIAGAEDDGLTVTLDGRVADPGEGGANLGPTVIDGVPRDHRIATEELFGPVLAVVRADNLDDALTFTNGSRYGNSTILFTESGGAARKFRAQAQAGMLGVNIGIAAPIAWMPFGGWKDSIDADLHANGDDAFQFYTRQKVVTSRWAGASVTTGGMRF